MCGGGSDPAPAPEVDQYVGPPGPGKGIGGVPIGEPDYKGQAQALMSIGQTYGQMASGIAGALSSMQPRTMAMAPPPAPQSAFDGGIGEYLAGRGTQPMYQPTPAMQAIESFEAAYDPRTSAIQMLESYEPGVEPRSLSYYTPESMGNVNYDPDAAAREAAAREAAARETAARSSSRYGEGGPGQSVARSTTVAYRGLGDMFDGGGPQASATGNDGPNGGFGGFF